MEWSPRKRNYNLERYRKPLPRKEVSHHPLKSLKVTVSDGIKNKKGIPFIHQEITEPSKKNVSTAWGGLDPLSALQSQSDYQSIKENERLSSPAKKLVTESKVTSNVFIDEDFEQWSSKKVAILSKYTTSEKLSIKTSFLTGGTQSGSGTVGLRTLQNSSVADKVKHRLEQLDDFEEGSVKEMLNLSQQEYVYRIDELNTALIESWEADQRVKALKIAIQCAKLLADVNVIQFYPSKFVLITDILDNFGSLVYNRIHCKSGATPASIESARETCRNWFFKVASIRELIPRLYVETAILKTFGFLIDENKPKSEYCMALKRLTKMIRGIGDPLVATYARAYLCRVAIQIAPEAKSIYQDNFSDFSMSLSKLTRFEVQNTLDHQTLDFSTYYTLYVPALNWIFQCLAYKASDDLLLDVFEEFKLKSLATKDQAYTALILNSILTTFPPYYVASKATEVLEMLKNYKEDLQNTSVFLKYLLIRNFGICANFCESIWFNYSNDEKLAILNEIWKMVGKFNFLKEYLACAEIWIEFVVKHFSYNEINTLLGSLIKHIQNIKSSENHDIQLLSIITKIINLTPRDQLNLLFSMENFMPFLDKIQKESVKAEACKTIIDIFNHQFLNIVEEEEKTTNDPVILNCLTYLCKTLHDSVSALTLEDERRQIANLIVTFLRHVSFKKDFEAQLDFYVESRSNFSNLETILCFLVHQVNALAMETRNIVKGHHTKKTTAFVRACLAYSYITIPSLDEVITRLQLYLSSSYVALVNSCLPQTDAFLKSVITLIPQLPPTIEHSDGKFTSTEPFLVSYVSELLSFLLVVPDHPDQEPFYLLHGLINVIKDYDFDPHLDSKALIYNRILIYLSISIQESYPYHINKVDSNDTLYGNEERFITANKEITECILDELLGYFKHLSENGFYKRQSFLALELFYLIIIHGNLQKMSKFALNLWQLAHKHSVLENKQTIHAIEMVKKKGVAYSEFAKNLESFKK